MKRALLLWGLCVSLVSATVWTLYGEETTLPDIVLQSIQLLKKPIEDLLPDLQEDTTTVRAIQSARLDLEDYQDIQNSRERWNEMRRIIESGQPIFTPLPSEIAISTSPAGRLAPAVPPPVGFTVNLPYESRLTVSGRKTIGLNYQNRRYTSGTFATTQGTPTGNSSFELTQTLQVRINGQVGRKVTVNVDFDDTKEDKKDISIVYKGDPDEIVQRAAFGDINLSLPATEFVGYSKQVFGASAELKYKALKGYVIGSRTKGETETKEFVGNVILQRKHIADIEYIRQRFYNYTVLQNGSNDKPVSVASVQVWLDTQDVTRSSASLRAMTVDQTLIPNIGTSSPTYSGNFIQLAQGIDYTVDPSSGVITFRNRLSATSVVAIDYLLPGTNTLLSQASGRGTVGQLKALKWDESKILKIPDTEELTHYSLGTTKIVRDNAQGNFTLQLRDLGNNFIGNRSDINVLYQPNNAGQILVDFEQGTFVLARRLDRVNPTLFSNVYTQSPTSASSFFAEFRSRVKTYTLRPNIVLNSERITMNGRVLTRDVEYFIDYESGFITFFNEDQITEDTRIQATYDFSPFGIAGAQQDTLVGERTELSLYPLGPIFANSLLGSTLIYNFAPKQTAAPDIRQTSGSFLVSEADMHFKDLIFNPLPFLKSSFSGEVARSARNPNTFGKALIDNMEGIKDESGVNLSILGWQIASNPAGTAAFINSIGIIQTGSQAGCSTTDPTVSPHSSGSDISCANLVNERLRTLDINPNASALPGDQTQVMNINYDLTRSTEASIVTVLSPSGIDFSKKLFLELWVQGDGTNATGVNGGPSGTEMNITLGQISEDFDGTAVLKSEDGVVTGSRNNTLDANEDIGISYRNPDGTIATLGAGNLRLDSNDSDRNGVLDANNPFVGGNLGYAATDPSQRLNFGGSTLNSVDYTGWKFVRVPLNISSATASSWSAVKEMRISLRASGATGRAGTIKIAKVTVVGNRWLADDPAVAGSTLTVKAINTEDDSTYSSPAGFGDFDELNQINTALSGPQPTRRKEQSLAINYLLVPGSTGTAKSVTISGMDFTVYGALKFFLYKNSRNISGATDFGNFVFRAGTDTDYWEFAIPVANLPADQWTEVTVKQTTPGPNQRANAWATNIAGSTAISHGAPNLNSVGQLRFGVVNPATSAGTAQNEIWIDELHAADVLTRIGYAARAQTDFEIFGWGTFGMGVRDIDRNFETFTSAITNQDRHEANAYLNISRLQYFPMKFTGLKRRTVTPTITNNFNSTLVSVLQEGRVDEKGFTSQGTLQIPNWPKLGLSYDTNKIDTTLLFRQDKTDRYGLTFDYTIPGNFRLLPKSVSLGYKLTRFKLNFGTNARLTASDPFAISDTRDDTHDISARLAFQPLSGFTFNPTYSVSTTREFKDVLYSTSTVATSTKTLEYDKARSQTAGFDGVLAFKKWLAPRLRYSITTRETFGIPLSSDELANRFKSVDRTSTGEMAWDFAWRDFSRKARPLQSLNIVSSYLIEDGDSWDKVGAGYNSLKVLSVRKALSPGNTEANRRQLTVRDTFRSTQRWSPFDWATHWAGPATPLRTMSLTSTYTNTKQRQETTGTQSRILTRVLPDLIFSFTQTEYFFNAQRFMSNSQLNLQTQRKKVDTVGTSLQKTSSDGGDWRFSLWRKLDLFFKYNRTTDKTEDLVNRVTSSDGFTESLAAQMSFNVGKWRFSPKYDQSKQETRNSSGQLTADQRTRVPALQVYADLFLPAGLRLPFGDLMVFSNRIRTTSTIQLTQKRSSLDTLQSNTDTYTFTNSEEYEMTSNIRLSVGGEYSYTVNKVSSDANFYEYKFNSQLTIQF